MPPRRKIPLTPERRAALSAELSMLGEIEAQATLTKYVHVSRAFDAGMTVREIGDIYGVSSGTIVTWKALGEQERARRSRGDTDRSEERESVG